MKENSKTTVVAPMYHEQGNVLPLVEAMNLLRTTQAIDVDLVAVNDGSRDNTKAELNETQARFSWIHVIDHETNKGFPAALKTGIKTARERGYDVLIFMDGDLTHDPMDIPRFIEKINSGYDVVVGSRYIKGGGMVNVPTHRVLISQLGNIFGGLLLQLPVKDLTSGYRAVRSSVFEKIELNENGFGIQLEELVKAYVSGFKLTEVPIMLGTRKHGESKMSYDLKFFTRYAKLTLRMASNRWIKSSRKSQESYAQ